jgi:hypothetical protein
VLIEDDGECGDGGLLLLVECGLLGLGLRLQVDRELGAVRRGGGDVVVIKVCEVFLGELTDELSVGVGYSSQ